MGQLRHAGVDRVGRWAWSLIGVGLVGLAVMVPISVWTHLGQRVDERSRWAVVLPAGIREQLWTYLERVSVELIAAFLVMVVVIALLRRRPELAFGALVVVGGANVSTQILKATLPRPSYGIGVENTLPSGHMTVVTSLLVTLVLVLPRVLRVPMVAVAGFVGTLAGASIVILRWHRPSDVLAAVGVCAVWLGVALLLARPWARQRAVQAMGSAPVSVRAGQHRARSTDEWEQAAREATADRAWNERAGQYFLISVLAAGLAGGVLVLGGLAAHEQASNAIVGGVTLSAAGIAVAALLAMGASGVDGLEAPVAPESQLVRPGGDNVDFGHGHGLADSRDAAHNQHSQHSQHSQDPPGGRGGEPPIWSR